MSHLSDFRQALLKTAPAALVSDSLNQRYLTGFPVEDALVLVTDTEAYLLTDFRYLEAAKQQCDPAFTILTPEQGHLASVRGILEEGRIRSLLIEEEAVSFGAYQTWQERLPNIELLAGASRLLLSQRERKDEDELAAMTRAQAITDAAFSHILGILTPKMTEREVALELEFFMRRQGAEATAFDTIAVSGRNSSRPHGIPCDRPLEKGFLTMDFGARVDGYCSDMTRTVVIGLADAETKRLYNTVLRAQLAALDAAAEGASCRGLDQVARQIIDADATYRGAFGHSLGHGVGLLVHENPRLSAKAAPDAVLQRGNVVTFEPGIYLEGLYGCRIEDMVAIRPDGSVYNFTQSTKELIEI